MKEVLRFALSGPVRSRGFELKHARARVRPDGTRARILAVKGRLFGAERSHHGRRQIMLTIGALRISARPQKQSGRVVDHYATSMRASFAHSGAIIDVELEADQVWHFHAEPRRVVLTPTPLGESYGRWAVSTEPHH